MQELRPAGSINRQISIIAKITSALRSAADMFFFADGASEGAAAGNSAANSSIRWYDPYYGERHEPPDKGSTVAYRHKKGANVLFFDGHAEWKRDDMLMVDPANAATIVNLRQWQPKAK